MKLDEISKKFFKELSNLHSIPDGAFSFRKNGKGEIINSTKSIEIKRKEDNSGINIYVHSSCQNESCHIPVVVTDDILDEVYNDFYIEDGAKVTIVAGCGVHSEKSAGHFGIHTFHVGKNVVLNYFENHLATGKGKSVMSPITVANIGANSVMTMKTTQLGGVDFADRKAKINLSKNSTLIVDEKILTNDFDVAKTDFIVNLKGENSKCEIVSKSVAKNSSVQNFKSKLVGKNSCYGRVECDGILLDDSVISSVPSILAKSNLAELSHEATIGKIANEQLIKLQTLGLNKNEAEEKIIQGFLK